MITFNIQPFIGAAPVVFGMNRTQVSILLGQPQVSAGDTDTWGGPLRFNVGYNPDNLVDHVGLNPGAFRLFFLDRLVWTPEHHPDPNPLLLRYDASPVGRNGFLIFTKLGTVTTGFHDEDPGQRGITVYSQGTWDRTISRAGKPDLRMYGF